MLNIYDIWNGAHSYYYGNVGAYHHLQYSKGYYNDIDRFWSDYKKNTGFSPVYEYKSGMKYDKGALDYAKKATYDARRQKWLRI